jgi:hypothetical protein
VCSAATRTRLVVSAACLGALLVSAVPGFLVMVESEAPKSAPVIEIRVAPAGATDVYRDGVALTSDRWMEFDVTGNRSGSYAFSQMALSVRESEVWRNGTIAGAGANQIHSQPTFLRRHLVWLRYDFGADESAICWQRRDDSPAICHKLPFYADRIVADRRGRPLLLGFDAEVDRFVVARPRRRGSIRVLMESPDSLHLVQEGPEASIVRVTGSAPALAVYFAMLELTRSQFGEPLAYGSDDLGRLAWNTRYRIDAMAQLAALTGTPRFDAILEEAALAILDQADGNGRLTSGKYSIDRETPIALLVNNAGIYLGLMRALPRLSPALQDRVLSSAISMLDSFEDDWLDSYRITPCIAHAFDGLIAPLNHQSLVGLLTLELHAWTGNRRFLDRAAQIWSFFEGEIEIVNGTALWPYWPDRFSAGWNEGDSASCNEPSRSAQFDPRYSDSRHARIDLEFAREASATLGFDSPVDVHAIGRALLLAPNQFSAFISGHVDARTPASYRNLPFLPDADAIAPYFARRIVLPDLDVNRQMLTLAYARAAQITWANSQQPWELTLHRYRAGKRVRLAESEVLTGSTAGEMSRLIDRLWPGD